MTRLFRAGAEEFGRRFNIFKKNLAIVDEMNGHEEDSATYGITKSFFLSLSSCFCGVLKGRAHQVLGPEPRGVQVHVPAPRL